MRFVNANGSVVGDIFSQNTNGGASDSAYLSFNTTSSGTFAERYRIAADGVATWQNVGGVAGTAMTLNSTGLGVGVTPVYKLQSVGIAAATSSTVNGSGGNLIGALLNSDDANSGTNPGVDLRRWTGTALNHGLTYIATNATGDTLFYNGTAASNTRATSLKMTLDASGRLLVGQTSVGEDGVVSIKGSNGLGVEATANGGSTFNAKYSGTGTGYFGYFKYGTTLVGTIASTGAGNCTFNQVSDYRLKEDVQPIAGALNRINSLKPSTYKWKVNGSAGEGFLAHELAAGVPLAVTGEKDAVNEDGSIQPQQVDLSKVVPILVAAIQELTARVQTLEAR